MFTHFRLCDIHLLKRVEDDVGRDSLSVQIEPHPLCVVLIFENHNVPSVPVPELSRLGERVPVIAATVVFRDKAANLFAALVGNVESFSDVWLHETTRVSFKNSEIFM